jgi:hypothetical protein
MKSRALGMLCAVVLKRYKQHRSDVEKPARNEEVCCRLKLIHPYPNATCTLSDRPEPSKELCGRLFGCLQK